MKPLTLDEARVLSEILDEVEGEAIDDAPEADRLALDALLSRGLVRWGDVKPCGCQDPEVTSLGRLALRIHHALSAARAVSS